MSNGPWTDEENDLAVANYFAMLANEIAGRFYNKAAYNRELQALIARSHGSIEYKHQNISAVLRGLGEDWLRGYKPAFNFQLSLVDAVVRWLAGHPTWMERQQIQETASGLQESAALWIGPAPIPRPPSNPKERELMKHIAGFVDVAARDEHNCALGKAGEQRVLMHERAILSSAGRRDLADQVRWVSQEDGDGAGFDIASFTPSGQQRLIEVKTTNGWERTPFHISSNELAVAEERRSEWCLMRLWNFSRQPRTFELRPPLDTHVLLTATSFRASFH